MLSPGTRLGPYEIVAPLGAGGMGEVLRARDTRIGREVAIKLLPPEVASDPDRLRRFEVEARAAGSLNHPNLVTIHEFGVDGGTPFLVMELLEGETLRDKLGDTTVDAARARIPLRKALEWSQQLATGLAAAHEKGIVHRDLKPENIFVTRDGRVKILDFGLARQTATKGGSEVDATEERRTSPGTVLGTVGYMSPEQVRGFDTDHRTDIFSCGAIFYEMLSGQRAFRGASSADTMSAILHDDPRELGSSSNSSQIPPMIDRVVRRCLEKEKSQRFESARDLAFAIEAATTPSVSGERAASPGAPRAWKRRVAIGLAGWLLLVVAVVVAYRMGRAGRTAASQSVTQLTFDAGIETEPAIAPDGKTFVFVKGTTPHRQLFLQRVDGHSAIALSRSADVDDFDPAYSPDGEQIAFCSSRDGGGIFVMGATGESVRRLTSAGFSPAWSPDGKRVVFASEALTLPTSRNSVSSLSVVDVATGAVQKLFSGDAMQPQFSPHGKRVVYWGLPPTGGQRDIYTIAANGDPKSVVAVTDDAPLDWNPVWAPDGRSILFVSDRGGTMNVWRVGIDEETGRTRGAPEAIALPAVNTGSISVAHDGKHVLYVSATITEELRRAAFDPATERMTVEPGPVFSGSMLLRSYEISPDGQWIAFTTNARQEDVYVMRADGSDLRQLTNDLARDRGVSWFPDSSAVAFYSSRTGDYDAWSVRVDGSDLRQLTRGGHVNYPLISQDGKRIAFFDLQVARVATLGPSPATAFEALPPIPGTAEAFFPTAWSADGTRLYGSTWVGRSGLYVYSFADKSYRSLTSLSKPGPEQPLGAVQALAVPIDGNRVLVSLAGDALAVADLSTGSVHVVGPAPDVSISRNGRALLVQERHSDADIWQLTLGEH